MEELESLLQQAISPEQFYRRYLQLLTEALPGVSGIHLWILQGRELVPLGGSDRAPLRYDENPDQQKFLQEKMIGALAAESTVFVPSGEKGNQSGRSLLITPLLHGQGGGAAQGCQICWWPATTVQESDRSRLTPVLAAFAGYCARVVRAQRLESMSQLSGQLQLMTKFLGEISSSPDVKTLAVTTVNRAREAVECDRCALVVVRPGGGLVLEAISNAPAADPRSTTGRTLLQLAEHARTTGLPALFRKASEKTEEKGDLSDYFYHSHMQEVLALGLNPPNEEIAGVLLLESSQLGFFEQNRSALAGSVVAQAATPLHVALLREEIPLRGLLERVARWRRLGREEKKRWRRRRLWIPAAVLGVVALFPVRMEFTGEAKLLPRERAVAVAQVDGRIEEVLAGEGETVKKGQPLARLDDTELAKQRDIAAQEESRLKAEADRLLALNERTAARIAQLGLQRAQREREFHEARLALATIRSPIDGIVLTPQLRSRQGDAMQPGSHLAMVGDPSSWELEVGLPETDVAALLARLRGGREVPVRFKLSSLPHQTFTATLQGAAGVAAASEVVAGRNVFRIIVPLPPQADYDDIFRAGYTGRARLTVGYRPWAYTVLRRFFNWARTTVLF